LLIVLLIPILALPACSQRAVESAGKGAVTGAAVGAVGGMVTALVFGGNVGDAAARGAVWGGSTGAASGAIAGTVADSNQKKAQQAAELEALRKKLGDDGYQGLAALAECKHEVAQGYGRTAAASGNPDYALVGLWLQVLAYADSGQVEQARTMFAQLIAEDGDISTEAQAESEMQAALKKLMEIRKEYNLPAKCS
jgi:hypothetical protein